MSKLKNTMINILAYPVRFFENLTDGKITLFAGIILIGAIDLLLPDITGVFDVLFSDKPIDDVWFNAIMSVFVIVVMGAVDVVFISVPLFDFFKYLKKKEILTQTYEENNEYTAPAARTNVPGGVADKPSAIKVMKAYIMSHFLIIPLSTIVYYALMLNITDESPAWMINLALFFFALFFIWSSAIIARGVNVLFRFNPVFRRLTFIVVLIWNFIFSMVFSMKIMEWLFALFR